MLIYVCGDNFNKLLYKTNKHFDINAWIKRNNKNFAILNITHIKVEYL